MVTLTRMVESGEMSASLPSGSVILIDTDDIVVFLFAVKEMEDSDPKK